MKILTICEGGNVRSVSAAYVLKYNFGHDAIAASWKKNSVETLQLLCEWADKIILMEGIATEQLPEEHSSKMEVMDVGKDRWMNPLHPELVAIIKSRIREYL